MNRTRLSHVLLVAVLGSLALAGCKKREEAATTPPPVASEPAPMPPAPTPAPAAVATVSTVDLGTAVGADLRVTTPMTTFATRDTVIAAIGTSTSDPAASVPGKLTTRWTYQDGQVVHEETKDVTFAGSNVTNFQISKPDGWPAGKYKLEVLLDGAVVQTREFEV